MKLYARVLLFVLAALACGAGPWGRPTFVKRQGLPPTVTAITPATGSTAGGTTITNITGTNFVATPTVTIGGVSCTSVGYCGSTCLSCTTGAHAAGAVDVVVTNPDTQSGTGVGLYTYATPAFDLTTLSTSLRFAAGSSLRTYAAPAGPANLGSMIWQGTPSAGISGNYDAWGYVGAGTDLPVPGPTIDGKATARFFGTSTTDSLGFATGTSAARSGTSGANENLITAGITEGWYSSTSGSGWVLMQISANPSNDTRTGVVQGPGSGGPSLEIDYVTSAGIVIANLQFGNSGPDFYAKIAAPGGPVTPTLNAWFVVFFKWEPNSGSTLLSIKVNDVGAWTTAGPSGSATMPNFGLQMGHDQYVSGKCSIGDLAYLPTVPSDATWDSSIYPGLKALYPGASLP